METIPRKGVSDSVPHLINRKDRFPSFHREGLHYSIDCHLPNNKVIFSTLSLLLENLKQTSGGKYNTIGNSLNSALTYGDAVSAEEGFE